MGVIYKAAVKIGKACKPTWHRYTPSPTTTPTHSETPKTTPTSTPSISPSITPTPSIQPSPTPSASITPTPIKKPKKRFSFWKWLFSLFR